MDIQEKRKLAHEYVMNYLRSPDCENTTVSNIVSVAWSYADAMEAQELQRTNENPLWKAAPEWAKFRAMNRDGDWFYFDRKPKSGEKDWDMTSAARTPAPWIAFFGDWSKSLHERA